MPSDLDVEGTEGLWKVVEVVAKVEVGSAVEADVEVEGKGEVRGVGS